MSGLINKAKEVIHGGNSTSTTHTTTTHTSHGNNNGLPEGSVGPHSNRAENFADPRVDSDLDSSRRSHATGLTHQNELHQSHNPLSGSTGHPGSGVGHQSHVPVVGAHSHGTGVGGTPYNTTGQSSHQTHVPGVNTSSGTHNSTAGIHNSNLLNKADPTIDSDLSGGNHLGAQSDARTAGLSGSSNAPYSSTGAHGVHASNPIGHQSNVGHSSHGVSSGLGGSSGHQSHNTTTSGPHSSALLNKADPMVDSDRSKVHGHNTSTTGTSGLTSSSHNQGTHGGISHSTNAGPHSSNALNAADPRVDSDRSGAGGHVGHAQQGLTGAKGSHATPGSGTAQNTAGPHNSDMLNKLDPRVDSDLDGSKTFMGNKTHN